MPDDRRRRTRITSPRRRRDASRRVQPPLPLPYEPRDGLLSRGELAFYRALRRVLQGRFGISIKTRLADIVKCPDHLWDSIHGRRLCQKHVDFVLYDRWSTRIVAVIELDDRSHDAADRRVRDCFVESVFQTTGVALIRIRAASRYHDDALNRHLDCLTEQVGTPRPRSSTRPPSTTPSSRKPSSHLD